jgi:hypothetical protein
MIAPPTIVTHVKTSDNRNLAAVLNPLKINSTKKINIPSAMKCILCSLSILSITFLSFFSMVSFWNLYFSDLLASNWPGWPNFHWDKDIIASLSSGCQAKVIKSLNYLRSTQLFKF